MSFIISKVYFDVYNIITIFCCCCCVTEFNLSDDVDDLADSLDLPIDPEMANQASKLFEEGFDFEFNELFPQDINSDEDFGYPSGLHSGSVRSYGPSESISVAPNF